MERIRIERGQKKGREIGRKKLREGEKKIEKGERKR
jgi:hypothetical protein